MFYSTAKSLIAVLVAALILTASASGATFNPPAPEEEADYIAALAWWGIPSPPSCQSVTLRSSPTQPLPGEVDDPDGVEVIASASIPEAWHWPCNVTVYENQWNATGPCMRVMVMRHEVGHLQGMGHSTDPASIMYPGIDPMVWCPEEGAAAQAAADTAAQEAANAAAIAKGAAIEAENAAAIARLDLAERAEHRREQKKRARCHRMHGAHAKRCLLHLKKG